MADRIESFAVATPAGTAIASAITTAMEFNEGIVERIEITIPPGPSGLVGFRIEHSGEPVIPYDRSKWIVGDNEKIDWHITGFPEGSAWALETYNEDVYEHTLYLRFHINEVRRSLTQRAELVSIPPQGFAEDDA